MTNVNAVEIGGHDFMPVTGLDNPITFLQSSVGGVPQTHETAVKILALCSGCDELHELTKSEIKDRAIDGEIGYQMLSRILYQGGIGLINGIIVDQDPHVCMLMAELAEIVDQADI